METLEREVQVKALSSSGKGPSQLDGNGVIARFLAAFDGGDRELALTLWDDALPPSVKRSDPTGHRLEFYLQIFFAIYPLLVHQPALFPDAVARFKAYIETKGQELAQTTEFLPFYALPYVASPATHPSFKALFQEDWAQDLRARTERFLSLSLATKTPELFDMYEAWRSAAQGQPNPQGSGTQLAQGGSANPSGRAPGAGDAELRRFRDKLSRMESHHAAVKHHLETKVETLEEAFKDLLRLATQMQFALRNSMTKGEQPPPEFLPEVKRQLAGYIAGGHLAEAGPGNGGGGNNGGGSNGGGGGTARRVNTARSRPSSATSRGTPRGGASFADPSQQPPPIPTPRLLAPLDYGKITQSLKTSSNAEICSLLQVMNNSKKKKKTFYSFFFSLSLSL